MNESVHLLLDLAEGPLFRLAFALMILGSLRAIGLGASDVVAAYLTIPDRRVFWRKLRLRVLWLTFPYFVLRQAYPGGSSGMHAYHFGICFTSVVFRITAVVVPVFMIGHVYLWERSFGLAWGTLPATIADVLTLVTIITGLALFLGRLYSPIFREIEPPWSFVKPLLLVLPFASGLLAMHPTWSPIDYYAVCLIHVCSAALVFVAIPFARLLTCMHTPLNDVVPEARWLPPAGSATGPVAAGTSE